MSQQITTISFIKYSTFRKKLWAFRMMRDAHKELAKAEGLKFYRLMGSGRGKGFNPLPDWSVYALLQVWDSNGDAEQFFQSSDLIKNYQQQADELWTVYMRNIAAVGTWIYQKPFETGTEMDPEKPIVVITRATIKWNWLLRFWRYVPTSRKGLEGNDGLIYTKGVGEVPIVQMMTFSLWENYAAVKKFAYNSKEHKEAIRKTRKNNWYKEELFARFQPYKSTGTWENKELLVP